MRPVHALCSGRPLFFDVVSIASVASEAPLARCGAVTVLDALSRILRRKKLLQQLIRLVAGSGRDFLAGEQY